MKGYKVFNEDWTCRDYQYEVGKSYEMDEEPICCSRGFHFCEKLIDCFDYYLFNSKNKVAEIEAYGEIDTEDNKSCTNKIKIVKELTWAEVLNLCNSGNCNSGYWNSGNRNSGNRNSGDRNSGDRNSGNCNSGDRNSGDRNSGDRNSGYWNSGNRNSGYWNSGYWNSGDSNSGDCNSGDCNSGNRNSGNRNSGDSNSGNRNSGDRNSGNWNSGNWNSGNWNSGYFNTDTPKVRLFNKNTDLDFDSYEIKKINYIMDNCPCDYIYSDFIDENDMTEEEKAIHPEYKTIGGYVKKIVVNADKQKWWDEEVTEEDKEFIESLPNFDADVFLECTGIKA